MLEGRRSLRLLAARPRLRLVLLHEVMPPVVRMHYDLQGVSCVAQDVPQVVPPPLRGHVRPHDHRLRLLRARRLRLVLSRAAGRAVPAIPRVFDYVRRVRPQLLQPQVLRGEVLHALPHAARLPPRRGSFPLRAAEARSVHRMRDLHRDGTRVSRRHWGRLPPRAHLHAARRVHRARSHPAEQGHHLRLLCIFRLWLHALAAPSDRTASYAHRLQRGSSTHPTDAAGCHRWRICEQDVPQLADHGPGSRHVCVHRAANGEASLPKVEARVVES
mmetsp:Transcript_2185/g.5429  ORF Transcript_2185/g.5429 Transcript_2185/m.5429 type:complete len:273 (+) Transcript_2185:107-925(+)